jgi:hypothetical protein
MITLTNTGVNHMTEITQTFKDNEFNRYKAIYNHAKKLWVVYQYNHFTLDLFLIGTANCSACENATPREIFNACFNQPRFH